MSRESELQILKRVEGIAKEKDDIKGHISELLCQEKSSDTSTSSIRDYHKLEPSGGPVLYVSPLSQIGDEFMYAWWAMVRCHHVLWKEGVYHRDVSPINLLHYRDEKGNVVGVLNDFDQGSTSDHATGTERTGTVPLMALDLLTDESLRGEVQHLYEHDAESFIWVLTWICLCYHNREPLENAELDKCLIVDALRCGEKRSHFLLQSGGLLKNEDYPPGKGHELHLRMAYSYFKALKARRFASENDKPDPWRREPETVFKNLFMDPIPEKFRPSTLVGIGWEKTL
ncbi:hypothetical protein F5I97DRAFT_1970511 [Phlebopus sp. FC_14]|nr:hypothetical protein F5I97DRAFT_1970511 [Phlebopus sp. FC_14]